MDFSNAFNKSITLTNFLFPSNIRSYLLTLVFLGITMIAQAQRQPTDIIFDDNWKFILKDVPDADRPDFIDEKWRNLSLPHDWSIEGEFNKDNPATVDGGALPGGIGWYRKHFKVSAEERGKRIFIDFDGVYYKSTVWINGHQLGFRPNGYISFRYDLTKYLNYGGDNIVAVKVDNSLQPNSRWYSGSGIDRNVWLVIQNKTALDHWGTFVTTPEVSESKAKINLQISINNSNDNVKLVKVSTSVMNEQSKVIGSAVSLIALKTKVTQLDQVFKITNPRMWCIDNPHLYKLVTKIEYQGKLLDSYETDFGIRNIRFDSDNGFFLNGKPIKILGVCLHQDLGALGSAFNKKAAERQLEILKAMGCNAIMTSHNPPAPEFLDLCDRFGFLVMDEAFDMWESPKTKYDYSLYFKEWHQRDLEDQLLRDRNHPSIFCWSLGNELPEQRRNSAIPIIRDLKQIVSSLDKTRPVTTANNYPDTSNKIISSGALDLIGYNYNFEKFSDFPKTYPGKKFIATETTSAFETRGVYDMPSDSIGFPYFENKKTGLKRNYPVKDDFTASAYDNPVYRNHEETWKVIKKYDFLSGLFIWTGFDYLGEPKPFGWPARSSYFGIVDLAGIPKDIYYMYQSEWTNKPMLHIFPHWNWKEGELRDIWAYYNQADEVELFLNGKSLGIRKKSGEDIHVIWRTKFVPGTLKAVSRKNGKTVLTQEIKTAGLPVSIVLAADRQNIKSEEKDLSYVTVHLQDADGNIVPEGDSEIKFSVKGPAKLKGVDNGDPTSHLSLQGDHMKLFHGSAIAIIQAIKPGILTLTASCEGLPDKTITINSNM